MSLLDSSSSYADVRAAYADAAAYFEDGDAAKARLFVTACTHLIIHLTTRAASGGEEVEREVRLIRQEKADAMRWLAGCGGVASGGAGVRHVSFDGFRR